MGFRRSSEGFGRGANPFLPQGGIDKNFGDRG
jgi:hypothetical protein